VIVWFRAEQSEVLAAFEARRVPAMVSPAVNSMVTVLLPTDPRIGETLADAPCSYVTTLSQLGGRNLLVLATRSGKGNDPDRWRSLAWSQADDGVGSTLIKAKELAQVCAEQLVEMFTEGKRDGIDSTELAEYLVAFNGWQGELIDFLTAHLPMPEIRERIDTRLCIGPEGPALTYPGMLTGPVEAAHFAEFIWIARSLAPSPTIRALLAPAWSRSIDTRFDVLEVLATDDWRAVKLLNNDVPVAFISWNNRWAITPGPPEAVYDEFLAELDRCCPWPWDRKAMAELIRTPEHDLPFEAFAHIVQVPSAEPFLATDDWTTLDADLQRIEPATGLKLTAAKMARTVGGRLPLGSWARIRLQGRSPYWLADSVPPGRNAKLRLPPH
jgi:hypothetical protein